MDILLMDPPYSSLKGMSSDIGYSIGLTSLAAYLREGGIDVRVLMGELLMELPSLDGWLSLSLRDYAEKQEEYSAAVEDENHPVWKKLAQIVAEHKPIAVGISYLTPLQRSFEKVAAVIKSVNPDIKVIAGGPHATFRPIDVIKDRNVDFVVKGEGELPLLGLIRELKKNDPSFENIAGLCFRDKDQNVRDNPRGELIPKLDVLPFPARDLVLNCDYSIYRGHCALTARGCPYSCSFCADKSMWCGKVRRRSMDNIIEELRQLKNAYSVDLVDFQDGTFTYDRRFVLEFCERLVLDNIKISWRCTARYDNVDKELLDVMKGANCTGLFFGLESGSDRILKAIDKKTSVEQIVKVNEIVHDSGIPSVTSVMFGLPDETSEDIEETLRLMESIETDMFDVNNYVPLPGSPISSPVSDAMTPVDWGRVGYKSLANYFNKRMSHEELNEHLLRAYEIADRARTRSMQRYQSSIGIAKS